MIVNGEKKEINYSATWGTFEELGDNMKNFREQINSKGYNINWIELPEGHSWGQWRATTDFILESFFPFIPSDVNQSQNLPDKIELFQYYSNLFNLCATIRNALDCQTNLSNGNFIYLNSADGKTISK